MPRLERAQFLSALERRDPWALREIAKLFSKGSLSKTVCITGPAGVGKSTFISSYIEHFGGDEKMAWLACDPTSPVSGGGLLGDRIRLRDRDRPSKLSTKREMSSDRLFVRSLATRSERPYSLAVRDMAIFLEGAFDKVLIETAGVGQTQWDVAGLAPITVLLLQPETGDEIQSMKAGLQERVDLIVVHKADLSGSSRFANELRQIFTKSVKILEVSSTAGIGFDEFHKAIKKLQSQASFSKSLDFLHQQHARDLYLEGQRNLLEKSFSQLWKKAKGNPYCFFR